MFIRIIKECKCTHVFWYDRHSLDRWKDDEWVKMKRPETLVVGTVIQADRIRPSTKNPGCCCIDVTYQSDECDRYFGIPWNCIKIYEKEPAKAKAKSRAKK